MPLHKNLGVADIHIPYAFTYADAAARTGASGFVSADVGKFARQLDTDAIYMLVATTPTWVAVGGSSGAVTSVFTRTGAVVATSGDYTASQITFSPNGSIAATNVQTAIQEVRDEALGATAAAGGSLGGNYPNPTVTKINETSGPTALTIGTIADGEFLKRVGSTLVSAASSFSLRDVSLFDHFVQGTGASGSVGSAGWIVAATGTGNNQTVSGEDNHPGVFVNTAGTASTARSAIHLGDTTFRNISATSGNTNPLVWDCMVKPNVSVASANLLRHQFGLGSGWALANPNPLTDGIYIRLEPGTSNNWQGVCANSSTRSTVNLGTATAGTWYRLGWIYTPTGTPQVQFYVNGVATGSPITTNIPTGLLGPGFRSDSGGGSAVDLYVDYVLMSQITP